MNFWNLKVNNVSSDDSKSEHKIIQINVLREGMDVVVSSVARKLSFQISDVCVPYL